MLTEQEKQDLALTIAGEIHPGFTRYGTEEAREEIAKILASIENRYDLAESGRYTTRSDVVKAPKQYSTWNTKTERAVAQQNYRNFKEHINSAVEDFYNGKLQATAPHATNYWSPVGMRHITGGRRSEPKWGPSVINRTTTGPHVFGTHKTLVDDLQTLEINSRIAGPEHGAPLPTGRGVTLNEHLAERIENYPEPVWSDQFAPGPQSAPKSAIAPTPVRSDYPTGPTNPAPWQDPYAPAPQYAPRTASPAHGAVMPGTSKASKMAAYRGLADTMAQAGVAGLDGRSMPRPQFETERFGRGDIEGGLFALPQMSGPNARINAPDIRSVPTPATRPAQHRPTARPGLPGANSIPKPIKRPEPPQRPPVSPPVPTDRPSGPARSTIPVPTPAPDEASVSCRSTAKTRR